jgi:hypothetical protein
MMLVLVGAVLLVISFLLGAINPPTTRREFEQSGLRALLIVALMASGIVMVAAA